MQARSGQLPSLTEQQRNQLTTLTGNKVEAVPDGSCEWSESRKKFLQQHQEKYLQRLTKLREALIKEKDLVRLSLPKICDKNTGFWEVIMADFAEASPHHKFPGTKSQRSYQTSVGGKLSSDLNRRGHLERLRRIRIMQMRRKLPPQLEPLHGVGLGLSKTNDKPDGCAKPILRVPPTTYHVDWLRGNHLVTPVVDQEKAFTSWTLKHIRTMDANSSSEAAKSPTSHIRTILRNGRFSTDSNSKLLKQSEELRRSYVVPTSSPTASRETKGSDATGISARFHAKESESTRSTPAFHAEAIISPYRVPPTPHSPFMTEIISHHSSSSSRMEAGSKELSEGNLINDSAGSVGDDELRTNMVDRACSPVGFRLPPLEKSARTSVSSSANSKRHIVVKIPDGNK